MISAAMIVRDGADTLDRCLSSLQGYVDEIVIGIDSRTKDNTEEIAKKYQAITFLFDWIDDFSYARNLVAARCSHDWILVIDADDRLEPGKESLLRDETEKYVHAIQMNVQMSNTATHQAIRCYRKSAASYIYRIHEYIKFDTDISPITNYIPLTIIHERSSKVLEPGRNLKILTGTLEEYPRYLFYAGREALDEGKSQMAIDCFTRYLPLSVWVAEKAEAYFGLAKAYILQNELEKAKRECLNAILIDVNFAPAYNILGQIAIKQQDYRSAVLWFEHSLKCSPTLYIFGTLQSTNFNSYGNLIIAYAKTGNIAEARMAVIKAEAIDPTEPWIKEQITRARI